MLYDDALKAADNQIIFRETVKAVGLKHKLKVIFLPLTNEAVGNSCHIHMSLWKNG
jgi:glutamine synthetase